MSTALSTPSSHIVSCTNCSNTIESVAKFCGECGEITELGSGVFQAIYETRDVGLSDGTDAHRAHHQHHHEMAGQSEDQESSESSQVTYHELSLLESYRMAQRSGENVGWAPTPTPTNSAGEVVQHNTEQSHAPRFAREGKQSQKKRAAIPESLVREMQSLNALLLRERIFLAIHWTIFVSANLFGFYLASQCYSGFHGDEVTRFVLALTPLTFINAVALACLAPIRGTRREISRVKERMQYLKVQLEYGNLF